VRRSRIVFLAAIIIIAAFIQFLLMGIQRKIASFEKFSSISSTLEHAAVFSSGIDASFNNFSQGDDTLILQLPATNEKYGIIPDSFDHVLVQYKNKMLLISLYPGFLSIRQHTSLHFGPVDSFHFGFLNSLFSFSVIIDGNAYNSNVLINNDLYILSQGPRGEVL